MQGPWRAMRMQPANLVPIPGLLVSSRHAWRQPAHADPAPCVTPSLDRSSVGLELIASRPTKSRRLRCAAGREPYPFREEDYFRVNVNVIANTFGPQPSGSLILFDESLKAMHQNTPVMVLAVSGDSLLALSQFAHQKQSDRPLALDLLWKVLGRGREISSFHWKLIRMAIVELRGMVYVGRLFFGHEDTGEVLWDCDCRPSDGFWLALMSKCPMYVNKKVWEANRTEMGMVHQSYVGATEAVEQLSGIAALTTLRIDDPDPLKLLKRKLAIAIAEENYGLAASVRDHPYMVLHVQAMQHRQAGRAHEAARIQQQLRAMIEKEADSNTERPRE